MRYRLVVGVWMALVVTASGCSPSGGEAASTTSAAAEDTAAPVTAQAAGTTSTLEPSTTVESADPPTKILFVGNSLTFYRTGLKTQMRLLAASATPPLSIDTEESAAGGATLEKHWNDLPTPEKIASGDYDIVVLQGGVPESDVETFQEHARNLVEAARESGAEPILFVAWPYERKVWITMDEIAQAHADIATELDVPVAPVGLAFERASSERPELNMLAGDNEHQSTHGAHLVTYVIYWTMFGTEPPDTVTDLIEGDPITEEDVRFLHRIARETVNEYAAGQAS